MSIGPYPIGTKVTVDQLAVQYGAPAEMVGRVYTITKHLRTNVEIVDDETRETIRITPIALVRS